MVTTQDQLAKFVSRMDSETLTKEDFTKAFQQVLDLVRQIMDRNERALSALESTYGQLLNKVGTDNETALNDLRKQTDELFVGDRVASIEQRTNELLQRADEKIGSLRDGKDGLKGERGEKGSKGRPPTEEEIKRAVKPWFDAFTKEMKGIRFGGTGGYTDNHVKHALGRMVKTETPSGDIDGANTDYTVTAVPFAVLNFTINGQAIHPSEYSISGKTITFTTALDSSLSGTSFTIVYV